ncbi:MAG: 2-phospho-L-lactate transferase CofD family protein [Burkholderiales bacterium]|nr:2-phospho-L-lactate transferase CofD family protein [Burkholderiales bacterium]
MGTFVMLGGQVGGAKLADGLYHLLKRRLTVVVNTGDDFEHVGLAFSPDLDTMLYTLGGLANPNAGWEPRGETRRLFEMLKMLGGPSGIPLGDQSLAMPILRTEGLAAGRTLSEITRGFCRHLAITARVVPMSDERVRTQLLTEEGAVSFQDYFSQLACEPVVTGFHYANAAEATIPHEIVDALRAPDLEAVVIAPCNPYHTVRPILETGGMKELLRKQGAPVIAVSPIVGGGALQGSAAKMMRELGHEPLPRTVAMEYYKLIDGFIIDQVDAEQAEGLRASGIEVLVVPTVMRSLTDRVDLAVQVIKFARHVAAVKAEAAESGA